MKTRIIIVITAALSARIILAVFTPFGDRPGAAIPFFNDEQAHLNYVRFVAYHHRLPVQETSIREGAELNEYEYYQPPLYYNLASPFYLLGSKLTPGGEGYWVRGVSVVFSLAGIIVLFLAVRRFFDDDLAFLTLTAAAFSGIPLRFGSLVTNDSLLFLIACLYFGMLLHILSVGCDRRLFLAALAVVSAGLWTKTSFLVLLPILPVALFISPDRSFAKSVFGFLLPLAAAAPWYYRNFVLYGNLLPVKVGFGEQDPVVLDNFLQRAYFTANYFVRSFHFPYEGLWGGRLDWFVYPLLGLCLFVFLWMGNRFLRRLYLDLAGAIAVAVFLNAAAYLAFNARYFQAEARLLMPAMPFILLLVASGAYQLLGRRTYPAVGVLIAWMALPWAAALF